MEKIVINVSGHVFVTTRETISRCPDTKLGRLALSSQDVQEHFFDADEDVFKEVLRYHRTGELHAPRNMCFERFCKELKFWNVNEEEIMFCCQSNEISDSELERQFKWCDHRILLNRTPTIRDRIWYFLTDPTGPYTRYQKASAAWAIFYACMVILQSINLAIFTLPSNAEMYMQSDNATFFQTMKFFLSDPCTAAAKQKVNLYSVHSLLAYLPSPFFVIEITVRLFSCPSKRHFIRSINMLDLLVAVTEVIQYTIVFIGKTLIDFDDTHPRLCMFLNVMQTVMFAVSQLRCLRLLAITAIFR